MEERKQKPSIRLSPFFGDYFGAQISSFKRNNIEHMRVDISSQKPSKNKILLKTILKNHRGTKKALFICHSMGGLSILDALEELIQEGGHTDLIDSIGGIIFIQTPFHGSDIATIMLENSFLGNLAKNISPLFGLSKETLTYLSPITRKGLTQKYQTLAISLQRKFPMINVATFRTLPTLLSPSISILQHGNCEEDLPYKIKTIVRDFFRYFNKSTTIYNGPYEVNDGASKLSSQIIDEVPFIIIEEVDHSMPILTVPHGGSFNKVIMTYKLIQLLLSNH